MMDQTHVMYYYWQQPMANTYVLRFPGVEHTTDPCIACLS